ncbi:60S ribosomal export protein NMD3-like [Trichoplusia ni]|nr:60S ribosomal export protein NMD3-like [Trichoplusia ni]
MAEELHEGLSSTNEDYNDFLDDLEEDPAFRQNVNIFKDEQKIPVDTDEIDPSLPRITLAEMLDDLVIEDVDMTEV